MQQSSAQNHPTPINRGQDEVQARIREIAEAYRVGNLDRLASFYDLNAVVYDCPPKLRLRGRDEVIKSYRRWSLSAFKFPIKNEIQEESLVLSGDLAVGNSLLHITGIFKESDEEAPYWLRHTAVLRKKSGTWLITHEHNSVPVGEDLKALMDISPDHDRPV